MAIDSLTGIANRHDFDKTFTNEYSANQDGVTLITPASGKHLKVVGVYISTDSTDGKVRIYFSDDENDEENTVVTAYGADSNNYVPVIVKGDRDAVLKIDSTLGGDAFFVIVNYKEI
jgi:hypothetical protein